MKNLYFIVVVLVLISLENVYAQLDFKIWTDKESYAYGENIIITCTVSNNTDSSINFLMPDFESCQAEFEFDNFKSYEHTSCFPAAEEIILDPNNSRVYRWTIDPERFGLPDNDGTHKITGYFYFKFPPYSTSENVELKDSLSFDAPLFLGGQLIVGFPEQNDLSVSELKDSLKAVTINRDEYPWGINETWQITDISLDSVFNKLLNDQRLDYIEYNRLIQYDSIFTITKVDIVEPVVEDYYLSNAYPNPFNPTTNIGFRISDRRFVSLKVYDILGREIAELINEEKPEGNYAVEFNGNKLSSGVYFYRLQAGDFIQTKKMILLR